MIYYLHTINDKPAAFYPDQGQICHLTFYGEAGPLATSLRQIKREQAASKRYRVKNGYSNLPDKYGHRRLSVPEQTPTEDE